MCKAAARDVLFIKDDDGSEPVKEWLNNLRKKKRMVEHSKIVARIDRAGKGNLGDHRMLGGNFGELRINFGPGYRVYFGLDGDKFVILLNGGTKQNQQEDIDLAQTRWNRYLEDKNKESNDGK
jgi:putative addiction module killer protein